MPSSRYSSVLAVLVAVAVSPTLARAQSGEHGALAWDGIGPQPCLTCHRAAALEVHGSAHYQWEGAAPYNLDGGPLQGKKKTAVNSYCVNITGNFAACGNCHVGRGTFPDTATTNVQLENIDCLVCHQEKYKRVKVGGKFVADTAAMGTFTPTQAVRTVHRPTRVTCLQCHAKGGGGDNYKRGDLALAHGATADRSFDVHMATTGGNLNCTACHTESQHRIAGRGSDLRQTDLDVAMTCSNGSCHVGKATTGHGNADLNKHVNRVACQTCHVGPVSARNASDTPAAEATEIFRDWSFQHQVGTQWHPATTLANNITPAYRFWNKYSNNYSFNEIAVVDAATGAYPTSRTAGAITDTSTATKLYPFKYKTAKQPYAYLRQVLVALDTSVFFAGGGLDAATRQGLVNMGYTADEPYEMVTTDTYQLLTHEIAPKDKALTCEQCHGATATQMNLKSLGYTLKAAQSTVCSQCHRDRSSPGWKDVHSRHVTSLRYDCSMCHSFTRPELGLRTKRVRSPRK